MPKAINDSVIEEMANSGWFRVTRGGRIETCYQWRACAEFTVPWFVCDRNDGKGYRYVSFRSRRVKAHRLAYRLYTGKPLLGLEINHVDGDKLNNQISNLELCDARRQSKHAYDLGLNKSRGTQHSQAKLDDVKVREIRSMFEEGHKQADIARKYRVTERTVSLVRRQETWAHVI